MKKQSPKPRRISTRQTRLDEVTPIYISPYAAGFIRDAAEAWRSTGEDAFTGTLDGDGQDLMFEVHYDPDFGVTGDDESSGAFAAPEWVRLNVRAPQFNLSLLEIWLDLSNRRLNIDDEIASEEARHGSVAAKVSQIDDYLNDVLFPAILARVSSGRISKPFRRTIRDSERSESNVPIDSHAAVYDFCEIALFLGYRVEIFTLEGVMLLELIDDEFELYKAGKRTIWELFYFLDNINLDPAIPRFTLSLHLASLFIGEISDAFRERQEDKAEGAS
jgi:hypothetical protein